MCCTLVCVLIESLCLCLFVACVNYDCTSGTFLQSAHVLHCLPHHEVSQYRNTVFIVLFHGASLFYS